MDRVQFKAVYTCCAYLPFNALLGDEGLQGSGLWVLGVAKVQDLCINKKTDKGW